MGRDVTEWLEELGLGKYAKVFAENDVDFRALPHLAEDDLRELRVSLGHRRILLAAIAELGASYSAARTTDALRTSEKADVSVREAERRQLTVLFCDLVGSTELSRKLDPEDLREVMRRYQDAVAEAVARYEGHVARFVGDGALVYFGWPRAYEDQAERAVHAGLAAVQAVANLKLGDGTALQARVGIATGQVVIGDLVGEVAAEAEAVTGVTPNLAARLQGVAAPSQVVIGSTTRLLVGNAFELKDLGGQQLKGFAEPVPAWCVSGESAIETRFEAVHPETPTQFIDRQHELGLLRRAWELSQAGFGQVVLISGEPGIGKSRLVDALSVPLNGEGCTRITLSCSPYHTNSALYPFIIQLQRNLRWQREDTADVKLAKLEHVLQRYSLALDEVIPLFAALLSLPLADDRYPPLNLTPQQQKQQTLDAVVAGLLEEAERQPVLQVWEDLQWADPSTLELLALEIEQAPTAPILNVLTFRPEFTTPWPQRSHMTPLTLNRLGRLEVEALITQQAGGKALPGEVVQHIAGKTDGVPLYVEELTKAILEAGFLRKHNDSYELTGSLSEVTVPATLQDSLMSRLDRLPAMREVAQLGAVLGREFDYEMLRAIASLEETTLQEGLDQLVATELLYQRGRPPRAKYMFKHALVQDAAYQSLLKRTRQHCHQQVAELLEARFPETVDTDPELMAHHYTAAGRIEQAVTYLEKAGRRAVQRSANVEAARHLGTALELQTKLPSTRERKRNELALRMMLGPALINTKGPLSQEAQSNYARAQRLCTQLPESPMHFTTLWGSWRITRNFVEKQRIADELLTLAKRLADQKLELQAHHTQWATLFHLGKHDGCLRHVAKGLYLYNPADYRTHASMYGGHDPKVCGCGEAAFSLWLLGKPDSSLERADDALAWARGLSHSGSLVHALDMNLLLHRYRRDAATVLVRAEELIDFAGREKFPVHEAKGLVFRGWALAQLGEPEQGIKLLRSGLASQKDVGTREDFPIFIDMLAEILGMTGRSEEGLRHIDHVLSETEASGLRFWTAELHRRKGELLLERNEKSKAKKEFRRARTVAREQNAISLELRTAMSLVRLWAERGKAREAHDVLSSVYGKFTEGFDTTDLKEAAIILEATA